MKPNYKTCNCDVCKMSKRIQNVWDSLSEEAKDIIWELQNENESLSNDLGMLIGRLESQGIDWRTIQWKEN